MACYTLQKRRYTPLRKSANFAQLHISYFSRSHFENGWFHFFHGRQRCYEASERITWRQSQHERSSWAPLDDRHTEAVKRSWKRYVITRRSSKCSLVNRHETPVKETISLVSKDLRIVQKGESTNDFCIFSIQHYCFFEENSPNDVRGYTEHQNSDSRYVQ